MYLSNNIVQDDLKIVIDNSFNDMDDAYSMDFDFVSSSKKKKQHKEEQVEDIKEEN